jgi:hypothetical protein
MVSLIEQNAIYGKSVLNRGVSGTGSPQIIRDNAAYLLNSDKFTSRTHAMSIGGMDTGQSITAQRNVCSLAWMLQNARAPSMSTNFDTVGLPGYRWLPKVSGVTAGTGQPDWVIGDLSATNWKGAITNSYGRQTTHAFSRLIVPGNPLNPLTSYCFYHLPEKDEVIGSLGLLQHVNFSPHFWMPHYPFGNSSPMMAVQRDLFYGPSAGVSVGARTGANISRVAIDADNALLDISTALNVSLWDRFFLSTLPYEEGSFSFNTASILPNSNHRVTAPQTGTLPTWSDLKSGTSAFEQAARYVQVDGGFNVNSTSVAAWKLLLSGTYNRTVKPSLNPTGPDSNAANRTVFPRTPKPLFTEDTTTTGYLYAGAFGTAKSLDNSSATASLREVDLLAKAIVEEVKRRGPFLSLADFVNRRLIPDQTNEEGDWLGLGGTLQVAIDKVTQNNLKTDGSVNQPIINAKYHIAGPAPFKSSEGTDWLMSAKTGQTSQSDMSEHMNGGTPSNRFAVPYRSGPGYLMQADVLQAIAPLLTVRGDTFVVRTYGDVTNPASGSTTPVARAWCEAVVQRIPETVDSADNIIQPGSSVGPAYDAKYPFGRRMKVVMFRWLSDAEVAQVVGQ